MMSTQDTGGAKAAVGTARDEAQGLAHAAADSGQGLLHEAKDQAGEVVAEAKGQARDLLGEAREGLRGQASDQQARAASGLRALGDELGRMADASEQGGLAGDLVRQVAGRTGSVATWLEDREPGDVLSEVTDFARRRPGLFLALAAGAGVLAGRLTRGLKDAPSGGTSTTSSTARAGSASFAGGPGVVAGGTAQVAEVDVVGEPQHREPGPASTGDAPWTAPATGEERAWAASGGEAPVAPTPGHLPGADDAGTAGGDPLAGIRREEQP
ncbi:hypothetical protein KQI48_16355 [Cellulomonas hominis]|uniref:hypothetical protein n=1 Tax=Cellulomonas hominis TaxID=156981 RepID=UPI001C1183FC|nr:hypothetical protein [Cellulomonas hominis]MBU5424243.1 hypothetical protein [Cellulomonas hominis]